MSEEKKSTRTAKETKVRLIKNIKYNGKRCKIGQEIEVDSKTLKEFSTLGVIAGE